MERIDYEIDKKEDDQTQDQAVLGMREELLALTGAEDPVSLDELKIFMGEGVEPSDHEEDKPKSNHDH